MIHIKVWSASGVEEINAEWFRLRQTEEYGYELSYVTKDRPEDTVWSISFISQIEYGDAPVVWSEVVGGPEDGKIIDPPHRI